MYPQHVVSLFLFPEVTGVRLAVRRLNGPVDGFGAFQLLSGTYLAFYLLGNMSSVFVYARRWFGIDTGSDFATGAPAGLVADAWNMRLLAHYTFAIFFAISHLASGLWVVLQALGARPQLADRWAIAGAGTGGGVALLVGLALCGLRLSFDWIPTGATP